jgi:6,7-dimethyl-8-ribityllumazine synthase
MELLEVIKQIEISKKRILKHPTHVLFIELMFHTKIEKKLLKKALNELFRNGKIEVGRTLNDKWIKSIEK